MLKAAVEKIDLVFIRKSSDEQEYKAQIANVKNGLTKLGVSVAQDQWFTGTVKRRKVRGNAEFNRLLELVEAGSVGTVYIESQNRFGTSNRVEFFKILGLLRENGTRLFDLRANMDVAADDFATEIIGMINSYKSEIELLDLSYYSMRTKVNNFKDTGSWPSGTQPFGFGKACYSSSGTLLWVWQPVSRFMGQVFSLADDGVLVPGPKNQKIPRKGKSDIMKLVPSTNLAFVESARLVFDLYTRVGLSRRKISMRLNESGRTHYARPFTHSLVTEILCNAAYAGDTRYGKTQTGELHSFDAEGTIVALKGQAEEINRPVEKQLIKEGTHKALIDRATWDLAQAKLKSECQSTSFSPRNPAYYLKQIFVCGHCGKGMVGRTERDPATKQPRVVYVCSTYMKGRSNGHPVSCGYHRISHEDAERLLLQEIEKRDLQFDDVQSGQARANIEQRLANLGQSDVQIESRWQEWFKDAINGFCDHLNRNYDLPTDVYMKLRKQTHRFYCEPETYFDPVPGSAFARQLPDSLLELREAIESAERMAVSSAEIKLVDLRREHASYTKAWAQATELQRGVLKAESDRLEAQIAEWMPRTVPLSKRLNDLAEAEADQDAERKTLLLEYPALEQREKGEALRRLFQRVTLYWESTFHPASAKPTRPRKTERPGRFSYALQMDRIQWTLAESNLGGCW